MQTQKSFLEKGLLLYYPFDGNAFDESSHEYHGIVSEADLTTDRHGKEKQAFVFDGKDDFIALPRHLNLLDRNFTISMWIEPHDYGIISTTSSSCLRTIFSYHYRAHADGSFLNSGLVVELARDPGCQGSHYLKVNFILNDYRYNMVKYPCDIHEWFLYTVSRENGIVILYLNGEEIFKQTFPNGPILKQRMHPRSTIGAHRSGKVGHFNFPFSGKIDEVRIYNRALSAEEVKMLY